MTQLDQPAAWRKAHRRRLGSAATSPLELLVLLVLDVVGVRDPARRPDVGWATSDDGRPMTRRELAFRCRLAPGPAGLAELDAAIAGLADVGLVVVDGAAVGVSGWVEMQESPEDRRVRDDERRAREAERKRVARAAKSGERPPPSADEHGTLTGHEGAPSADSPAPSADSGAVVSRERTEDRGQIDPVVAPPARVPSPAPSIRTLGQRLRLARERGAVPLPVDAAAKRAGLDPTDLRRFETDKTIPTRDELGRLARVYGDPGIGGFELPEQDPDIAREVARAWHRHRVELGLVGEDVAEPAVDGTLVRQVFTPAEGGALLETWRTVLRRAAEEVRRGKGRDRSAEFFRLDWLCRPTARRRYLDAPDLDRRLDEARERAPPRGRGQPAARATGPKNNDMAPRVRRDEED